MRDCGLEHGIYYHCKLVGGSLVGLLPENSGCFGTKRLVKTRHSQSGIPSVLASYNKLEFGFSLFLNSDASVKQNIVLRGGWPRGCVCGRKASLFRASSPPGGHEPFNWFIYPMVLSNQHGGPRSRSQKTDPLVSLGLPVNYDLPGKGRLHR